MVAWQCQHRSGCRELDSTTSSRLERAWESGGGRLVLPLRMAQQVALCVFVLSADICYMYDVLKGNRCRLRRMLLRAGLGVGASPGCAPETRVLCPLHQHEARQNGTEGASG
ncbi:unnamed protein product [Effrenium voratum]|nr:unnamed protein product [Effrenium voratum]